MITTYPCTLASHEQLCYNVQDNKKSSDVELISGDQTTRPTSKATNTTPFIVLTKGVMSMDSVIHSAKNGKSSPVPSRKRVPRDNPQDILARMKDHKLIVDSDHWTGHAGRQANFRYALENKTPLDWALACSKNAERHCIACGSDMKGREVWEYYKPGGNKRTICKLCRHEYTMDEDGNLQCISPRVISQQEGGEK